MKNNLEIINQIYNKTTPGGSKSQKWDDNDKQQMITRFHLPDSYGFPSKYADRIAILQTKVNKLKEDIATFEKRIKERRDKERAKLEKRGASSAASSPPLQGSGITSIEDIAPEPVKRTRKSTSKPRKKKINKLEAIDENPFGVGITTAISTGSGKQSEKNSNPLPFFDTMDDNYFIKL